MKESTTQIVKSLGYRYDDISVHLKDDKVIKIEGDSQSNEAALERLYHTNRLQYPQMRLGDIHNGKWKQISWDEAFDIIAEKLNTIKNRYGAEHVAFGKGYRRPYSDYVTRLANVFGTPNVVGVGHVCYVPRAVGSLITCGYDAFPDMDYPTKCMVWWGIRGCPLLKGETKLIVVNTQKTEAAAKADVWLQPRPATDLALALGILNIIINGELYDKDFVEKWTTGFDKLKEYVQKYTPEKVAEITWVPVKKIIEAAKLYATSSPSWIKIGNAIEDNLNSVQCARALSIMSAITGNLDIPGGDIEIEGAINNLGGADITLPDKLPRRKQIKKIGAPHGFLPYHPLWDLAATMPLQVHPQVFVRAVLEENPYPIKAFCIFGSNPLLTWSNVNKVYSALKKLEFLVVADFVMTPTARLAHIVLPVASYLEQDSVIIPASRLPVIKVGRQVTRIGECRSDFEIIIELAKKLGLRKYFWEDVNSFLDAQLEPIGMTFEEL